MQKRLSVFLCILMFLSVPMASMADDITATLDNLNDKKTRDNYITSIDLCEKALQNDPDNFEILWRYARACRWNGELAKRAGLENMEDICTKVGKKGMEVADKAIKLKPDQPHGYFWYGSCVGTYKDGVGLLAAIKEGLKDQTQSNFEKAYEIDKMYEEAGPILALGRFWSVLPWPLKDNDKALEYFREYQKTEYFNQKDDGPVYLAECLIDEGGDEYEAEAKQLCERVIKNSDNKWFKDWAQRLLEDI